MKNRLIPFLFCLILSAAFMISGCRNVKSPTAPHNDPALVPAATFTMTDTITVFTSTITPTNTPFISATVTRTVTQTNTEINTSTITETVTPTVSMTSTMTVTQTVTPTLTSSPTQTITPTPTSTATCQVIFGNTDAGNRNIATGAGYTSADHFIASSSSTVNSIRIFGANQGPNYNGNFVASIYSDASGKPGTLLGQTAVFNTNTEVWAPAPLLSPVAVTSGTTYWILVTGQTNGIWVHQEAGYSMKFISSGIDWATVQSTGMPADLTSITWINYAGEGKVAAYLCN